MRIVAEPSKNARTRATDLRHPGRVPANRVLGEDLAGSIQVASLFELKGCEFLLLGGKQ